LLPWEVVMAWNHTARRDSPDSLAASALAAGANPAARSGPFLQLLPNLRDEGAMLAAFSDLEVDFFRRGDELDREAEAADA
jgi:hypothetical protein